MTGAVVRGDARRTANLLGLVVEEMIGSRR